MPYPMEDQFNSILSRLQRSKNTIKGYNSDLVKYFNFAESVTQEDVQNFVYKMSDDGSSPTSITRSLSAIKTYCGFFDIHINFSTISKPRQVVRESAYITDDVFESGYTKILEETNMYKPVKLVAFSFKFLYETGLRIDEFLSIKKEDIDFTRMSIIVIGKGNKQRRVPLHNIDIEVLRSDDFYEFVAGVSGGAFLLWTKKYFGKQFSPHSFRHGYTTRLIKNGASRYTVKSVLGHSSYITTMRYFHLDYDEVSNEVAMALS